MFNVKDQEVRGDGYTIAMQGGVKTQKLEVDLPGGEKLILLFDALGWLLTMRREYGPVDLVATPPSS